MRLIKRFVIAIICIMIAGFPVILSLDGWGWLFALIISVPFGGFVYEIASELLSDDIPEMEEI